MCSVRFEGLTRLILDDGMLYELEMWKYAREVKVRDLRPDLGHRHRHHAEANAHGCRRCGPTLAACARPEIDEKARRWRGPHRLRRRSDHDGLGRRRSRTRSPIRSSTCCAKAGRKVDGFNLGVGNYNTSQELALFRDVGARLKPDIIVLCLLHQRCRADAALFRPTAG